MVQKEIENIKKTLADHKAFLSLKTENIFEKVIQDEIKENSSMQNEILDNELYEFQADVEDGGDEGPQKPKEVWEMEDENEDEYAEYMWAFLIYKTM